jgi:hypothetical protein
LLHMLMARPDMPQSLAISICNNAADIDLGIALLT